jgi:hypothetical protein
MKNSLKLFFFIAIYFVFVLQLNAQQNIIAERNSNVNLTTQENYPSVQWEISSDNSTWYSIAMATQNAYTYKVTAPAYIRAKQTSENAVSSYSQVHYISFEPLNYLKTIKSSGGQGYAETNGQPATGISIKEDRGSDGKLMLTAYSDGWTNTSASLVWYLYHTAGQYDIDLMFNISKNSAHKFQFSIADINNSGLEPSSSIISTTGKGTNDTLTILSVNIPKTGYYKYELKPLSAPENKVRINGMLFKSLTSASADVHASNYLSSPSVHLGSCRSTDPTSIAGKKYDWCYMEILVPTGGDALSTYYMSLGVLNGYMGIQTNSANERGVIFSMWDDGDTDTDPTLDQFKRAGAVDYDPATTVSRFGNEGTGTKSFVHGWNWNTNVPVKFLTNARLEEYKDTLKNKLGADSIIQRRNTLVSAWYHSDPTKGWKYISTLRLPNKVSYFDSWYSFIENFGYTNGQIKRLAYYYNGFAHEQSSDPDKPGRWMNFNQVNFSNTDGAAGQRSDFEQGRLPENPNYFYMATGGYANTAKKFLSTSTLQTDKSVVESIDLSKLLERVDDAILKEKIKNDSIKNIKNNVANRAGWVIESFSSQETSGEGTVNGRAVTTIDGDANTFWHSAWQSGTATFPHHIAINMNKFENVTGFLFKLSGGTTRHMKSIELWGSLDGTSYSLMKQISVPDAEELYVALDQAMRINKFKLIIKTSQSGEVHCRINEINAIVSTADNTGIKKQFRNDLNIFVDPITSKINIQFKNDEKEVKIKVYDMSGKLLHTEKFQQIIAGERKQLTFTPIKASPTNYIVNVSSGKISVYSKTI